MLKILYVAGNRSSSFYSLKRFIDTYSNFYTIKTAAYSASIRNINVNWNLDALLDFTQRRTNFSLRNSNVALFKREIIRFNPDIIISDMEIYSSYLAMELNIKLWQVSPLLLHYGTFENHDLYQKYSYLFFRDKDYQKLLKQIFDYSEKKLILSHLGDTLSPPEVKKDFEWVRPNYLNIIGDNIVANATHLADYYFNGKGSNISINYNDEESIITGVFNQSRMLSLETARNTIFDVKINVSNDVKFLSQHLSSVVI